MGLRSILLQGICSKDGTESRNLDNLQDWLKERDKMIPRLQAMRMRLFNKAVSKGQLQTAAQILDSLGKVIGESVETVNIQAPELSIKVEPKN